MRSNRARTCAVHFSLPRAKFVAAVDRSASTAALFCDRYRASSSFTDTAEMLTKAKPDVVHVLTPPGTHEELIRLAMAAGSHVICEKPMTANAADSAALLEEAAGRKLVLVESANTMWNENVLALHPLIDAGTLGRVREVDIELSLDLANGPFGDLNLGDSGVKLPGGAVHDFLPHMCGAWLFLAGQEEANGLKGTLRNASGNRRVGYDLLDCIITDGPVRGRLKLSPDINPPAFAITVRGSLATAETELFNPFLRVTGGQNVGKRAPFELISSGIGMTRAGLRGFRDKVFQHTPYHGLVRMLDDVYAALQNESSLPSCSRLPRCWRGHEWSIRLLRFEIDRP
ncbi:Gfo/Idh/MocA family oxidoreductase [Sphingomonas rhizophila]|uniref:Gfo/Idh/MocA family oxidoreductase n=1 Tax=Sphingomonas rhizophila TaxID=2071607 RepID=A0A7G9S8Y1_9SPHN|nr:Gfo/Idh/MocA family oxidoreductase [Sphingomonas rhizophila]QNN64306.1 Gfo/Idh/MocA family oxidoreductase [Sphingomonas rhizophila]